MKEVKGLRAKQAKIQHMLNKRDKLLMVEALIYEHERADNPDIFEIKDLKRRAHELRTQIAVSSTLICKTSYLT